MQDFQFLDILSGIPAQLPPSKSEKQSKRSRYAELNSHCAHFVTRTAILLGGVLALNITSSIAVNALRFATDLKLKRVALPCGVCRGKGFYICKLCKGNANIHWSPLYDPVAFNPCLCPTCDGNRVQRCLNCLGKGYS
ncbi:PLASTID TRANSCRIPTIONALLY ACTIVE PROTEIN [Salix viminalis]|uniref:PLASTID TRANSCRIPTIONALLY ACTIVE PROTEIN n=1 Tax=Salix viminalis TaxID=40686 RepID=A0A9Q0QBR5_SALVM|nr:PLASTID TRANSCRIPTIONALLY ACTIVE PROTEIN [Salix viminalis]